MSSQRIRAREFAKNEPEIVAEADWRLQVATWVTKQATINGHNFPEGSLIALLGQVNIDPGGQILEFCVPSVTALLLNHSARLDITNQNIPTHHLNQNANVEMSNHRVFDFLESRMASTVFSYTALESFANENISQAYASGYRYEPTRKSQLSASYDLQTIERSTTLEEKLATVIPEIFSVPSPKGRRSWNQFQRLKKLRDRIIHCKMRDRATSKPNDDVIWRALFLPTSRKASFDAYSVMRYFYQAHPKMMPRWFANWPYNEPE